MDPTNNGFDASQFSLDPSNYVFDPGEEGQYKRSWAYRFGAETGLSGNETYEQWMNRMQGYYDRLYEQDSQAMQRQYEMYMDSTRYQRLVDDLKAAGLNPWLALNGGSAQAGSVSVGNSHSPYRSNNLSRASNGNDALAKLLTGFMATAFMVARFLG